MPTRFRLGINSGFATNRYPEPEVWLRIVGRDLGIRCVQFVADLLHPLLPDDLIDQQIGRILRAADRYGVEIHTCYTSSQTRYGLMLHPDPGFRRAYFTFLERFLRIAARLGAKGAGSNLGALSITDLRDPRRRDQRISEAIRSWQRLSRAAKRLGLQFLIFEPMSVPRELPHTISETKRLYQQLNQGSAIPILLNLDVDHGDLASPDPRDTDPYSWLRELAHLSPVIHLKQSCPNKGGHWPFTPQHNRRGIIRPRKVLEAIEQSGAREAVLALEISHRERLPWDEQVEQDLAASVSYWRRYVKE